LTLEVQEGEVFGFLGPNGAGKTTTFRMLAGLIPPTRGNVRVAGIDLSRRTAAAVRGRVGFLTETPGLWERLPVRTNLLTYARLFGIGRPDARVDDLLRTFDLWDHRHDRAALLSKGLKQRVSLARALVHDPAVVLLDEPTAGLDPHSARGVRELILTLGRAGRAVLVSTHNLDEAERVSDRIAVIERRLIASDTPARLRQRLFGRRLRVTVDGDAARFAGVNAAAGRWRADAEGPHLYVALDQDDPTPDIVRALVQAGADVREVVEERRPLEDVYLRLITPEEEERRK
jgi:ABC-2 type transport system ATP-binding protein